MSEADYQSSVTVDDGEDEWQVVSHRRRDHDTTSIHGGSVAGGVNKKTTGSQAGGGSNAGGSLAGGNAGKSNKSGQQSNAQSTFRHFHSNGPSRPAQSGKSQAQGRTSGTTTPKQSLSRAPTAESTTGAASAAAAAAGASESRPRFMVPASLIQAVADAASSVSGGVPIPSTILTNVQTAPSTGVKPLVVYDANTPRDVVIAPELRNLLKTNNKQAKKAKAAAAAASSSAAGADISDTMSVKSDKSGHSVKSGKSSKASRNKYGYGKVGKHAAAEPVIEGSWRRSADDDRVAEAAFAPQDPSKSKKKKKKARNRSKAEQGGADDTAAIESSADAQFAVKTKAKVSAKSTARMPVRASTASGIVRTASQNTIIHEENDDEDDDGIVLNDEEEEVSIGSDEYTDDGDDDDDDDDESQVVDDHEDGTSSLTSEDMIGTGVLMIPPKVLYAPPPKSDASSNMSYADHLKRTLSNHQLTSTQTGDAPISPLSGTSRGPVQVVAQEQSARGKLGISRSNTAPNNAAALVASGMTASAVASSKVASMVQTNIAPSRANKVPGFSDDEDDQETPQILVTANIRKPPAKGHPPTRHNTIIDGATPPSTHAAVAVAAAAAANATSSAQAKPQPPVQIKQEVSSAQTTSKKSKSSHSAQRASNTSPKQPPSLSEDIAKALSIDQKQLQAAVGVLTILILLRLLGLL